MKKTAFNYLCIFVLLLSALCVNAYADASVVKLVKSDDGKWKMTVDGRDYFIKGMEYSPDTIGKYPDANDWMWEDSDDNGKIDAPYDSWVDAERDDYRSPNENAVGDFALLKAMGCNTIRIYSSEHVNKELLRDLFKGYGIRVIMGDLFGAYTKGSGANWHDGTDYIDETQRKNMRNSIRKMVLEHKDEPYLLMWMLGNENDSPGNEINSTKTNTNAVSNPEAYATFLNEVCLMIKQLDGNHPIAVCNATTNFLKYYRRYAPDVDILGFNQYSGPYGFGVLWNKVKAETGKPVLITEYGCDAYNSVKKSEDERFQSKYHESAWRDIENNSYWSNGSGNSLGGVVYCWLDKWWLIGSAKVHDTDLGAWKGPKNDGYFHDEWFGICSQGDGKQSPFKRQLREVYFTYQEKLWTGDITKKE